MKYLLLINTASPDSTEELPADGPTVEEFMAFEKTISESGVKLDGRALDNSNAVTVKVRVNGERVVTDGPTEKDREIAGGYYLIDVPDLDTAIDWAARCPGSRYGTVEVRTVWEHDQA
ncbi:YciI family protein [Actinomadura gamaensis]|uniref:YciI family protein n=1 Tax=Actinomadura gamaensis TaxID=1763541 RepID=A0ABV9TYM4_9ACTN